MFAVQCSILDGDQKGRKIFFNRVISGNSSPKWTDGMAIKSVCTWLDKLETETMPEFFNYGDFADCVLDIFQEVQGKLVQQSHIRLITSIRSRSMKPLICKIF